MGIYDDDPDLYQNGEFIGYENTCRVLRDKMIREMLRTPPKKPEIAQDYRPEDTLDLIHVLKEGTTCIIPTCDIGVTLDYLIYYKHNIKISISVAEDEGWTRIKPDNLEGRLPTDYNSLVSR